MLLLNTMSSDGRGVWLPGCQAVHLGSVICMHLVRAVLRVRRGSALCVQAPAAGVLVQ